MENRLAPHQMLTLAAIFHAFGLLRAIVSFLQTATLPAMFESSIAWLVLLRPSLLERHGCGYVLVPRDGNGPCCGTRPAQSKRSGLLT